MAAYGNTKIHAPNLNKLAGESVVFQKAYVTQPVCTPNRSAVMTGLWPHTSGCTENNIPLTRGEFAIVDPEDYPRLAKHKWHLAQSPTGSYAVRWQRLKSKNARTRIWMHRQVINIPKHMLCDHINRIGLDNRKANLRPAQTKRPTSLVIEIILK